jgi:hypothetical protein
VAVLVEAADRRVAGPRPPNKKCEEIQRKIIGNPAAAISETGFARLVMGVNGSKELAAAIARRQDLPAELRVWLDKALHGG